MKPDDRMLEVEAAQRIVLDAVHLLGTERVGLTAALGRILREEVVSPHDVPERDNTAMDGYAVRAEDLATASRERPVRLSVIEDLPAGRVAEKRVEPGSAVRIMTGALIPEGADAVIQHELTDAGTEEVNIYEPVARGTNIRRQGEDMRSGEVVLPAGLPLDAAEIGVLAGVQKSMVTVGRRPSVAIISTGDEIVEVDETRTPGKVANSNSYALAALTRQTGAVPRKMGIVRDTRKATVAMIGSALESDFILSSGGVSVGAYDFVKDALEDLGAEVLFWQVAMKPGRPLVFARLGQKLYFGLPGNPVSCMVAFLLFIAPAIRKAMGQREHLIAPTVVTRLDGPLRSRGDRRFYQRVRVVARDGELHSVPMLTQGSGVSTSMVEANGFAVLERGITRAEAGERLPTLLFGRVQAE